MGTTISTLPEKAQQLADDASCPAWCAVHLDADDPLHLSEDATMTALADQVELTVSIEQLRGVASVRLQNAGDVPMTPDEALHLAGLLILAARRAQS